MRRANMNKFYKVHWLLHQCAIMKRRLIVPWKLLSSNFIHSETYFPELKDRRKSKVRIFFDLMAHVMKYGAIDNHYFAYGFDIKGLRKKSDYFDEGDLLWRMDAYNKWEAAYNYTCILRDKRLFGELLSAWNISTPRNLMDTSQSNYAELLKGKILSREGEYFCKPIDGSCGRGIFKIITLENTCIIDNIEYSKSEAVEVAINKLSDASYIIQPVIHQHKTISNIYDSCLNTMRLVTVSNKYSDQIKPVSAVLRIGCNGNIVDNYEKGGVSVGVDLQSGSLVKYGMFKYGRGTKTEVHPNTNVKFEGIQLPYFTEAIEQAIKIHSILREIPVIGWDIAFTESGPIFIEGNDNIEISISQQADGGLRPKIESLTGI